MLRALGCEVRAVLSPGPEAAQCHLDGPRAPKAVGGQQRVLVAHGVLLKERSAHSPGKAQAHATMFSTCLPGGALTTSITAGLSPLFTKVGATRGLARPPAPPPGHTGQHQPRRASHRTLRHAGSGLEAEMPGRGGGGPCTETPPLRYDIHCQLVTQPGQMAQQLWV